MKQLHDHKHQIIRYLAGTFLLAYIIQAGAAFFYLHGHMMIGQLLIAATMGVPTLGAIFAGARLKEMGWRLELRKNIKVLLFAWMTPMVMTIVGAMFYFLLFPGQFDLSGAYLIALGGEETLAKLKAADLSYTIYVLINAISALTYAPLLNMFLALGEEIGWRGFLYPWLKARLGHRKGWLLGGIIWGVWHWPLIGLIGYEYGTGYVGFPIVGMLLFCVVTTGWGIWHDWLYEKSGSIWVPALFHGAINAAATLPLCVCLPQTGSMRLLGPAPVGLVAALPFLVIAGIIWLRVQKTASR